MLSAAHQSDNKPECRSVAQQCGSAGSAVLGAVAQMAYNIAAVDPAGQASAVALRNSKGAEKRHRFNVATVSILEGAASRGTDTKSSSGAGKNFHAERNALNGSMGKADIAGFNSMNGRITGVALKAGRISNVNVYTELPPCGDEGCDVYLKAIEGEIDGDVNVSFSNELDDWEDLNPGQKTTAWDKHLTVVIGADDSAAASSSAVVVSGSGASSSGSASSSSGSHAPVHAAAAAMDEEDPAPAQVEVKLLLRHPPQTPEKHYLLEHVMAKYGVMFYDLIPAGDNVSINFSAPESYVADIISNLTQAKFL